MSADVLPKPRVCSPAARKIRRIEVVANPASGSVGPGCVEEAGKVFAEFGVSANIQAPEPMAIPDAVRKAIDSAPDLIVILAGDGTARSAAALCGPDGPLLAPLPGGTMNMLPHALYGVVDWKTALALALEKGVARPVSGGEVDGRPFYVAAILGAPALFAYAREEVRAGHVQRAVARAKVAWRHVFSSQLRFRLGADRPTKAPALTLMCPLVSRAMEEETALEAVCLNYQNAADGFRLGLRTVVSSYVGDWRLDPTVSIRRIRTGEVWARRSVPAVLDGEPQTLPDRFAIRFDPTAFRALAPEGEPVVTPQAVKAAEVAEGR
jgi:diacylglycerol kinase family enzyme